MNYIEQMKAYIAKEEEILSGLDLDSVNNLMNVLEKARKDGRTVFICGNGGSAATASHFVCDFCKGVSLNQEKKYNFECLSDNTPLMTAIANDIGYDDIFVIPLKAKMHPGDVVVGISGSGNSENVVRALSPNRRWSRHLRPKLPPPPSSWSSGRCPRVSGPIFWRGSRRRWGWEPCCWPMAVGSKGLSASRVHWPGLATSPNLAAGGLLSAA